MKKQQSGFTIIELVVVIILLGIMAATALPRFMNVTDEAHESVVNGVQGGLQSGAALYHAQWVAEGQGTAALVDFGSLTPNATGYPAISTAQSCDAIYNGLLQAGAPSIAEVAPAGNTATDFAAVENGTSCEYWYTGEKSTAGDSVQLLTYNSANGEVSLNPAATIPTP